MSKSTDVTLNIKARNLAGKTLDEINAHLDDRRRAALFAAIAGLWLVMLAQQGRRVTDA